jgi:hypothetical protein
MPPSSITIVADPVRTPDGARAALPALLRRRGAATVAVHDGALATAPHADLYLTYAPIASVADELSGMTAGQRAHVAPRLALVSALDHATLVGLEQLDLLGAVDAAKLSDWTAPAAARMCGPRAAMYALDGVPSEPRVESTRYLLWQHPLIDAAASLVLACADRMEAARSMSPLPELPAPWRITDWLRGETRYGQARCVGPRGRRAIATFSLPPVRAIDEVGRELAPAPAAVAPIAGMAQIPSGMVVLLEEEPAGLPLSTPAAPPSPEAALGLFAQLLAIVDGARDAAHVLRGLRPELVYWTRSSAGPVIAGVVPRGEALAAQARTQMGPGIVYPFETLYAAPEVARGLPATAASGVFSACAILLYVLERRAPWQGDGPFEQLGLMLQGPPAISAPLDAAIARVVRAGLEPDPARRPSPQEIRAAIGAAGIREATQSFLAAPAEWGAVP